MIKNKHSLVDLARYGTEARKSIHSSVLIGDQRTKYPTFKEGDVLDANATLNLIQDTYDDNKIFQTFSVEGLLIAERLDHIEQASDDNNAEIVDMIENVDDKLSAQTQGIRDDVDIIQRLIPGLKRVIDIQLVSNNNGKKTYLVEKQDGNFAYIEISDGEKGDPFEYDDFTQELLDSLKVKGDKGDRGDRGISIVDIRQSQISYADRGINKLLITLDDGTVTEFLVLNGTGIQYVKLLLDLVQASLAAQERVDRQLQLNIDTLTATHQQDLQNVQATIELQVENLINGAPAALDTLGEIANKLSDDDDAISAIVSSIADETSARQTADTNINNRISLLDLVHQNDISTITDSIQDEATRASNAEDVLQLSISNLADIVSTNKTTLETAISTESTRAQTVEASLSSDISTLSSTVNSKEAAINTTISNLTDTVATNKTNIEQALASEVSRALTAEQANASAISSLTSTVETNRQAAAQAVSAEETRARSAEKKVEDDLSDYITSNNTALQAEATRAGNAESALDTRIDNEVSARSAKDTDLQNQINTITGTTLTGYVPKIPSAPRSPEYEASLVSYNKVWVDPNGLVVEGNNPTTLAGHGIADAYTKTEIDNKVSNVTNDAQVKRTEMGTANGVATLDANGLIPSSQLPSYVDDVLEYSSVSSFPATGETGKIYVDTTNNLTYRWSGSTYTEISKSLALGETSSTAYGGDKGKALADKLSGIESGALVHRAPTTAEVKSALGTGSGTTKYLREDGEWKTPPNTEYSAGTGLSLSGTQFSLALTKALVTNALGYTPPTSDTDTWRPLGTGASDAAPGNHTHSYIVAKDSYTFTSSTLPNSFDYGISAGFVNSNAGYGSYGSVLTVRTFSGGGGTLLLYAPYSNTYGGSHMKARFGNYDSSNGNSWTTLKSIAWTDDIPTNLNLLTNGPGYITGITKAMVTNALGYTPPTSDTWRGILNNLTSTSTSDSLSAYQGYLLANGSARDSTKLPLTGGTLTGSLSVTGVLRTIETTNPGSAGKITFKALSYNPSPHGIVFKGYSNGTHSIQVKREGNETEFFPLSLNPQGGDVLINGNTPITSGNYVSYCLKNYGNSAARPNGSSFTLPGGSNAVQMRSGATSGSDIGIFHLSDDNAFICNSSDNNYTFAVFDTDKTTDFSNADNSSFAVLSDKGGCTINGHRILYDGGGGGTLVGTLDIVGALGKSDNYVIKPKADFRTTSNSYTGYITITLPQSIGNTMVSMWIDVYNYSANTSFSVHCGGYTYSNSTWANSPFAMVYGASHRVRMGYYNSRFVIYIGEANSTWSYPQVTVRDVIVGYQPTYPNWLGDWSISFTTTAYNVTADITRYAITSSNIGSLSVNNADTVDSQHFTYSNSSNSPTYLWGTNSNGSSFLASRSSLSVNYATTAGTANALATNATGTSPTFYQGANVYEELRVKYGSSTNPRLCLVPGSNGGAAVIDYKLADGTTSSLQILFNTNSSAKYLGFWDTNCKQMLTCTAGSSAAQCTVYVGAGNSSISYNSSYKMYVYGQASSDGWISRSDIRLKDVIEDKVLTAEDIANAPSFSYKWKSEESDNNTHIGTSAQYWKEVLPEAVIENDDEDKTLSMAYGQTALVSTVSLAKEVVTLKNKIEELTSIIEELKAKLEQ